MPFPSSSLTTRSRSVSIFQAGIGSRYTLGLDLPSQCCKGRLSQVLLSLFQPHADSSHSCSMHSCLYFHQSPSPLQLKELHKHNSLFSTSEILMSISSHLLLHAFCRWSYRAIYMIQHIVRN